MEPLTIMGVYFGGMGFTAMASYLYAQYIDGRGISTEYMSFAEFFEDIHKSIAVVSLLFWPLVLVIPAVYYGLWPIRKLVKLPGKYLFQLGKRHKEDAETKHLLFREKERLLQRYEHEIDEFLKGKS